MGVVNTKHSPKINLSSVMGDRTCFLDLKGPIVLESTNLLKIVSRKKTILQELLFDQFLNNSHFLTVMLLCNNLLIREVENKPSLQQFITTWIFKTEEGGGGGLKLRCYNLPF